MTSSFAAAIGRMRSGCRGRGVWAVLTLLLFTASIGACGSDDDDVDAVSAPSEQVDVDESSTTTGSTSTTQRSTTTTTRPTTTTTSPPSLEVMGAGLSTLPSSRGFDVSAGAVVRNSSHHTAMGIVVNLNLKDAAGRIVKTETVQILGYIPPGTDAHVSTSIYLDEGDAEPVSVETQASAREFVDQPSAYVPASDLRYESGKFSASIKGTLTNTTDVELTRLFVMCVTFAGGQPNGGGFTFVDLLPGGSSTGFDVGNGPIQDMHVEDIRCTAAISG